MAVPTYLCASKYAIVSAEAPCRKKGKSPSSYSRLLALSTQAYFREEKKAMKMAGAAGEEHGVIWKTNAAWGHGRSRNHLRAHIGRKFVTFIFVVFTTPPTLIISFANTTFVWLPYVWQYFSSHHIPSSHLLIRCFLFFGFEIENSSYDQSDDLLKGGVYYVLNPDLSHGRLVHWPDIHTVTYKKRVRGDCFAERFIMIFLCA